MKTTAAVRAQIGRDTLALAQQWEARGIPVVGAMLRLIGYAYRTKKEVALEQLMDMWHYTQQRMEARLALVHGKPIPDPDERARTPKTARRHQRYYELLGGAAARERRAKEKAANPRRR